jgi:uncharacterized protein YodC (DUF2158 family)
MPHEFETGDTVQLKSGGPAMTVKHISVKSSYEGQYVCQWFGGKKLEQGFFMPESLKRVEVDGN